MHRSDCISGADEPANKKVAEEDTPLNAEKASAVVAPKIRLYHATLLSIDDTIQRTLPSHHSEIGTVSLPAITGVPNFTFTSVDYTGLYRNTIKYPEMLGIIALCVRLHYMKYTYHRKVHLKQGVALTGRNFTF